MAEWTPEASEYLDGYLKQVHALAKSSGEDADEIASGLRDHIATKVAEEAGPLITVSALRQILAAVGSPEGIVEDARNGAERTEPVAARPPSVERIVVHEAGSKSRNVLRWVIIAAILVVITPVILAMLGIVAAIIIPALSRSREAAHRAECQNNLKQIGMAIELYEENHPDATPQKMSDLYPKYIKNIEVFACPSSPDKNREPRELDDWASYAFNATWDGNVSEPIIREKVVTNHRPAGRNLAFNDQRVEFVRSEDIPE